jgi:pimeloyl-ACP methyl ester carboxylesterase
MGCGKSETSAGREYTLRTHVENLTALIDALDLRDVTRAMRDWGGPIGFFCLSQRSRSTEKQPY